jgi:hypothetical protein
MRELIVFLSLAILAETLFIFRYATSIGDIKRVEIGKRVRPDVSAEENGEEVQVYGPLAVLSTTLEYQSCVVKLGKNTEATSLVTDITSGLVKKVLFRGIVLEVGRNVQEDDQGYNVKFYQLKEEQVQFITGVGFEPYALGDALIQSLLFAYK